MITESYTLDVFKGDHLNEFISIYTVKAMSVISC